MLLLARTKGEAVGQLGKYARNLLRGIIRIVTHTRSQMLNKFDTAVFYTRAEVNLRSQNFLASLGCYFAEVTKRCAV